jgi:hypothetical protein
MVFWFDRAVAPSRVQETFRGKPWRSRPPKTPITFGPTDPASLGKRTFTDSSPVITISTLEVNGLLGQPKRFYSYFKKSNNDQRILTNN